MTEVPAKASVLPVIDQAALQIAQHLLAMLKPSLQPEVVIDEGALAKKAKELLTLNKLVTVPQNWKLVPMVPDLEMLTSTATAFQGINLLMEFLSTKGIAIANPGGLPPMFHAWIAMVANAPAPDGPPRQQVVAAVR